jgi:hypothetical protein
MITVFAKLLIAHLIGDFIIFYNKRLKEKGKPLWRSRRLILHAFIHFVLAWIAFTEIRYWPLALTIGISHYMIDLVTRTKLSRHPQIGFTTEQLLHLLLIFFIAVPIAMISFNVSWIAVAGLVGVTFPAARFIEVFLAQWPPAKSADKIKGLANAGLWIGILERMLIYILIVSNHWEGIGFLLAAKSIFRFGDLTNSKDISLTEYIMVGTLLSFCLAVITGLTVNYLHA